MRQKKHLDLRFCIIHNPNLYNYGEIKQFTELSWNKIKDSKELRLQSDNLTERKSDICEQIPEDLDYLKHGYHRLCYQTFTLLPKESRKRLSEDTIIANSPRKTRTFAHHSSDTLFDQDMCIFCQRKTKYVSRKRDTLIQCVTDCAKACIAEAAKAKSDFRMISLTECSCLIAQQAHYHRSCHRDYVKKVDRHDISAMTDGSDNQKACEKAHSHALRFITDYVQKHIIDDCCVERITMLKEKYLSYLQSHFPDVYNPEYKTYKLKDKLIKAFGDHIQFWQPNYKSELVFSKDVPKGAAIETAFEQASSEEKRLEEAALILRREVLAVYENMPPLPWPPSST